MLPAKAVSTKDDLYKKKNPQASFNQCHVCACERRVVLSINAANGRGISSAPVAAAHAAHIHRRTVRSGASAIIASVLGP